MIAIDREQERGYLSSFGTRIIIKQLEKHKRRTNVTIIAAKGVPCAHRVSSSTSVGEKLCKQISTYTFELSKSRIFNAIQADRAISRRYKKTFHTTLFCPFFFFLSLLMAFRCENVENTDQNRLE